LDSIGEAPRFQFLLRPGLLPTVAVPHQLFCFLCRHAPRCVHQMYSRCWTNEYLNGPAKHQTNIEAAACVRKQRLFSLAAFRGIMSRIPTEALSLRLSARPTSPP